MRSTLLKTMIYFTSKAKDDNYIKSKHSYYYLKNIIDHLFKGTASLLKD